MIIYRSGDILTKKLRVIKLLSKIMRLSLINVLSVFRR